MTWLGKPRVSLNLFETRKARRAVVKLVVHCTTASSDCGIAPRDHEPKAVYNIMRYAMETLNGIWTNGYDPETRKVDTRVMTIADKGLVLVEQPIWTPTCDLSASRPKPIRTKENNMISDIIVVHW